MSLILVDKKSSITNYKKLIFRHGKFFLSFSRIINNLNVLIETDNDIYLGYLFDYLSFKDYVIVRKIISNDTKNRNYFFMTKYPEKFKHLLKTQTEKKINYRHFQITFGDINKLNSFKKSFPNQILKEKDSTIDLIIYQYYLNEFIKKISKYQVVSFLEIKN